MMQQPPAQQPTWRSRVRDWLREVSIDARRTRNLQVSAQNLQHRFPRRLIPSSCAASFSADFTIHLAMAGTTAWTITTKRL